MVAAVEQLERSEHVLIERHAQEKNELKRINEQLLLRTTQLIADLQGFQVLVESHEIDLQPPSPMKYTCAYCEDPARRRCACKSVYYCCVAHQQEDWKVHKSTCAARSTAATAM
eukprot:Phypoly_transcript_21139.p1 GENE.Phypoly_transcript_21139~~Phypoly_transcript_21139.p1  ORF type:complete len:114 (+),score=10.21 Phypoly_transcript_21139:147-488(+)